MKKPKRTIWTSRKINFLDQKKSISWSIFKPKTIFWNAKFRLKKSIINKSKSISIKKPLVILIRIKMGCSGYLLDGKFVSSWMASLSYSLNSSELLRFRCLEVGAGEFDPMDLNSTEAPCYGRPRVLILWFRLWSPSPAPWFYRSFSWPLSPKQPQDQRILKGHSKSIELKPLLPTNY